MIDFEKIFPFDTPRQNQRKAVLDVIEAFDSGKRFAVLNAPVGFGKSAVAVAVANHFNEAYILTKQKMLQDQYVESFPKRKIYSVYGKSNYRCNEQKSLTCDIGFCTLLPAALKKKDRCGNCSYYSARDDVFKIKYSVMNYDYFLSITQSENTLVTKAGLLVCDECHSLEDIVVDFATATFNHDEIKKRGFDMDLPKMSSSNESKLEWIKTTAVYEIQSILDKLESSLDSSRSETEKVSIMRTTLYFNGLMMSCKRLADELISEANILIIHDSEGEIKYKPIHCGEFIHGILFNWGVKVLMMSATIFGKDVFLKSMHVKESDCVWLDVDSTFPVENSPKILQPIGKMSYKEKQQTLPNMLKAVDEILEKHSDEKGIIHTVSYDVCDYIIKNSKYPDRLVVPRNSEFKKKGSRERTRDEIIKDFLVDVGNTVLISPSLTEGISLDGDISRFTVMCKVPYASLGDKWISVKLKQNQEWYNIRTAQTIVQMTGRSIRSETDYATTYFLDSDFLTFLKKNMKYLPHWWMKNMSVAKH
jgi:Rad3-related DNA helicase